jgi:hypothetical protein
MSEYEETDSLTLAVANAIMKSDGCGYTINGLHVRCDDNLAKGLVDGYGKPLYRENCDCVRSALAAIKAYELHQALTNRDIP